MQNPFNPFFDRPIINSPYEYPWQHWKLEAGQPTGEIVDGRREADFKTPIPRPKQRGKGKGVQQEMVIDEEAGLSTEEQQYDDIKAAVNDLRQRVDAWRKLPNRRDWGVTEVTARLLLHWRQHQFSEYRPFFCQIEAVETLIWLTEVAPREPRHRGILNRLSSVSEAANPGLLRRALKLATGSGKTTVMAMLIAWQTLNAVRSPRSPRFTTGFLVVAPGLTIKDRLRVLQPNDPDNYYKNRELIPGDLLPDMQRARIVITNYHALRRQETRPISAGGRDLLQGHGPPLDTLETEGQMLKRAMPKLLGLKNIMALNDEGHHCYRRKPGEDAERALTREEQEEARQNTEEARVWISGLEAVKRTLGLQQVVDLSATPFFLRGSGYAEGTLFPWTVCDFSLMDAIECGIVKLPRVPVSDNIPSENYPRFRNLWEHIRSDMPRAGRRPGQQLDPAHLPAMLQTALQAIYGHYQKTFAQWQADAELRCPPCFIVVCNNTATSKLVYDYISGYERQNEDGETTLTPGQLELFRNFDPEGSRCPIPRTLLIDSRQLEAGDKFSDDFRRVAAAQIEQFRRERQARSGSSEAFNDEDLLREVMNTVGKEGRLGESIRCVVSVSMLTEGWDANTVTHILGVRAFGTQLLCEQVVGRALRRQSYALNDAGLFNVEYADVLGIPFDFNARPVIIKPIPHVRTIQVRAISPERDHLEITFPRVVGYREDPPKDDLTANFTEDSRMELTPDQVGPTVVRNEGIIGEGVNLTLAHTGSLRTASLAYYLTKRLLETHWRDANDELKLHLFGRLKSVVRQWLDTCLACRGGTWPAQLMYLSLADRACERIAAAITNRQGERVIKVLLDSWNPTGSTGHVNFNVSNRKEHWQTDPRKCHVNYAVLDSGWEGEFCRVAEKHPRVLAYVKNHNLGLEVPYRAGACSRRYFPDFILQVDDGRADRLNLIVEVKGFQNDNVREKKNAMEACWLPGVNALGRYGRWAFAQFNSVWDMDAELGQLLDAYCAAAPEG